VWNCKNPVAYVIGRQILLTLTAINEALDFRNPSKDEMKVWDVDRNGWWLVDTFVTLQKSLRSDPRVE
ncbi:hypothetical protein HAX54_048734, partial [Datura stramonium]|nr:hypothetical protein [Datura stramonium]